MADVIKMKKTVLLIISLALLLLMTGFDNKRGVIIAFGDSNTAGSNWGVNLYDERKKWVNKLQLNHTVINAGIGGQTTDTAKKRFQRDVLNQKPKVVTIMFGTNDAVLKENGQPKVSKAEFGKNLGRFVYTLKARKSNVILMTTIPVIEGHKDRFYYSRHNKELYRKYGGARIWHNSYNDIVRKIAKQYNVTLIDNYRNVIRWAGGETDTHLMKTGYYDPSGTHFSPAGADIVYRPLSKILN